MKPIILSILVAFIVVSCNNENIVVVSGKISNPLDEPTRISINYFESFDTVVVNNDGTFYAEIDLEEEHLARFVHGMYSVPLYLVPGAVISLEFDTKDFKDNRISGIKVSGEKSEATTFLNSEDEKWNSYDWQKIIQMPLDSFTSLAKSTMKELTDELERLNLANSVSAKFVERATFRYDVMLVSGIDYYKMMHQDINDSYLTECTEKIPEYDEELCKEVLEYRYHLVPRYKQIVRKTMDASGLKKETSAYINRMADEIIALDVPQSIKDEVGEWNFSVFYKRPDSLRKVYIERYFDVVKNQEYIDKFNEHVATIERTKPGANAPIFSYPDIEGKIVSLASFKGKVIYIDVWATWCGPCKSEIPHQKKLEAELHGEDVAFVSISIDEDINAWKNMVKEKELGGYQLCTNEEWDTDIVKQYGITGIPRFIIIDKEGKIVEAYATRPSNPETKDKLLALANS